MLLDGQLDHSISDTFALAVAESATFEATLNAFFAWCNVTSACALRGTDIVKAFDDLITGALVAPIPALSCNGTDCRTTANAMQILASVQEYLGTQNASQLNPNAWAELAISLNASAHGDASNFSAPIAPNSPSPYAAPFAERAVLCLDWNRVDTDYASAQRLQIMLGALFPHTRGSSQSLRDLRGCAQWPVAPTNLPKSVNSTSAALSPTVLLLQATQDPETSIQWAMGVKQQLPNSVSVIRRGAGHGSVLLWGETSALGTSFLVNGTLPADNTITYS
jgi:hypothetical protein